MAERHLYNDKLEFEGSMDDYGNIYDECHSLIGHVDGNTIYDSCNVPHGHINADGQVTDMCNIPTGQEFGASFKGWNGNGSGLVRNDVLGSGHGNDYGIFLRVKNANRRYGIDDGSEESGDKDDSDKQEDSEYDTDEYLGDDEEIVNESGESVIEDEEDEDDAEWDDYELSHGKMFHRHDGSGGVRSAERKHGLARPVPMKRQGCDSSYVPPDSFFSTGRRNEYRINGITYVDVSGKSGFWGEVISFFAGLSGKGIITEWDRMSGTWDRMKQGAYRKG